MRLDICSEGRIKKRMAQLEIKEVGTIHKKEEPDCISLRTSSKTKPIKDYHTLSEKYRVANRYKNLMIGIVVAIVMWCNNWICIDGIPLKLLFASGIVLVINLLCEAVDEILME